MKISLNTLIGIFTLLGVIFTILAIKNASETVWNITSMIFMILATIEFVYAIRLYLFKRKINQIQNGKK